MSLSGCMGTPYMGDEKAEKANITFLLYLVHICTVSIPLKCFKKAGMSFERIPIKISYLCYW